MLKKHHTITLELDKLDAKAVNRAIARRQSMRVNGKSVMPDGGGNMAGRVIAEICRGWEEMLDISLRRSEE